MSKVHSVLMGLKLKVSMGVNSGLAWALVSVHVKGGKESAVGPDTARKDNDGNDAEEATFASIAPYLKCCEAICWHAGIVLKYFAVARENID